MTITIAAALQVLDQCQQELETETAQLRELAFSAPAMAAIKAGLKIRIWMHKANLKALELMIAGELENQPLNPCLLQP